MGKKFETEYEFYGIYKIGECQILPTMHSTEKRNG